MDRLVDSTTPKGKDRAARWATAWSVAAGFAVLRV